jgi:restriction system protein
MIVHTKIVLIDGNELSRLMVDHNIGGSTIKTYETSNINSNYFLAEVVD